MAAGLLHRYRPLSRHVPAMWLLVSGATLDACASEDSKTDRPDGAMAAPGPGLLGGATCTECLETHCALQSGACDSDPGCRALRACRTACATAECDRACLADVPEGGTAAAILESLSHCSGLRCGDQCGQAPVVDAVVRECTDRYADVFSTVQPHCPAARDCACEECADDWIACLDDPYCPTIVACPITSPNGCIWPYECATACGFNGRGFDLAYRAQSCVAQRCEACDPVTNGGSP